MKCITRRKLLQMGVGAAAAAGAPGILMSCSEDGEEESGDGGADGGQGPDESEPDGGSPGADAGIGDAGETALPSRVAAVRGSDLSAMTRDVLDAIGGIETVVHEGETVFLKPNMIGLPWANQSNPFITGECTKPEILIAVAESCLMAGAAEVIIGDASHRPTFSWEYATTLDNSTNLVVEAGRLASLYGRKVTLACLDTDSPEMVEIPTSTYLGKIAVSSLALNADRVISLPVLKTHSMAQLTLSLKNFLGVTALQRYANEIEMTPGAEPLMVRLETFDHSSPEAIAAIYLDIVDAVKPDLAIIDASIGIEANGPSSSLGGLTVDMKERLGSWLMLASTDLVAADATAARITGHDPASVKQLVMASDRGLGKMQEASVEMVGESLDSLKVEWTPAVLSGAAKPAAAS